MRFASTPGLKCVMAKGPKMKSNRAAAKRFRVTGKGKIKRQHACHSHINTKKTTKRKRRLRQSTLVFEGELSRVRKMLVV